MKKCDMKEEKKEMSLIGKLDKMHDKYKAKPKKKKGKK